MKILLVGRAKECNIMIDDLQVSRNHLQLIQTDDNEVFIVDLKSKGGTYINGHRIEADQPQPLQEGDIIRIGSTLLKWADFLKQDFEQLTIKTDKTQALAQDGNENLQKETIIKKQKPENEPISPIIQPSASIETTTMPQYAGFGIRTLALLIDLLIIFAINLLIWIAISLIGMRNTFAETHQLLMALAAAGSFISLMYFAVSESQKKQATVGKHAMGLKVSTIDGKRIHFFRSLLRQIGKIISTLLLFFGFFMAGFTLKKQALHDFVAQTVVVK